MKAYVGVTDNKWFEYLAERKPIEVNFWRPGGNADFKALEPGGLFLFKLHMPHNYIVGGGFFIRYSILPSSLAWEAFGEENGMPNREAFFRAIRGYRFGEARREPDPKIGCILLAEPFFFSREDWIPAPDDFQLSTVQGKGYSDRTESGRRLIEQVQERLSGRAEGRTTTPSSSIASASPFPYVDDYTWSLTEAEDLPRYGTDFLAHARLGQGAFRILVTEAYERRCAMTGEKTLPVLEAAHIRPYSDCGPHRVANGLLLRSDLHILFDKGFVTIDAQKRICVSARIKEEFGNGKEYYALHGQRLLVLPSRMEEQPSREFLEWHNQNRYIG